MNWPENPFWDYSLDLHGSAGVETACLDLQRRHGLDVNLLLWACWLASLGIELDQATANRARKAVSSWQKEVVRPLRALRRRLGARIERAKPESIVGCWPVQAGRFKHDIMTAELDGEHLAQLALHRSSAGLQPSQPAGPDLACLNLARLFRFRADDLDDLRTLLRQAFPSATQEELDLALRSMALS